MCLYATHSQPHTAEQDMVSYKVARVDDNSYFAPYQGTRYILDTNQHSELVFSIYTHTNGYEYKNDLGHRILGEVDEGFHSVKTLSDARKVLRSVTDDGINWGTPVKYVILKCTIPKGATYYTGRWNKTDGFTSSEIIIHKNALTFMEKVGNFTNNKWHSITYHLKTFFNAIFW